MYGSIEKYFGSASDTDGNRLTWSPHLDLPFRGPARLVTSDELESLPTACDAKAEVLLLPRDLPQYQAIIDAVANGAAVLRKEIISPYDAAAGGYPVFISWLRPYYTLPRSRPIGGGPGAGEAWPVGQ